MPESNVYPFRANALLLKQTFGQKGDFKKYGKMGGFFFIYNQKKVKSLVSLLACYFPEGFHYHWGFCWVTF